MKPDPFLQWLDEIEEDCRVEIINPYPERYERCLERSIKLTAALRKSYEANQFYNRDSLEVEDVHYPNSRSVTIYQFDFKQLKKTAEKAIQELHEIAGVNDGRP